MQTTNLKEILRETVEVCEECKGTGYISARTEGSSKLCGCKIVFQYLLELVKAGIPKDYWTLSLRKLTKIDKQYTTLVKYFIRNIDKAVSKALGLFFIGSNGLGKTSLMCEVGKHAIVCGYKVRYITMHYYVDLTREHTEESKRTLDDISNSDIILLDELDKAYGKTGSDYMVKTVEDFVRRSISNGRVIIACSNTKEAGLSEIFGKSVLSMIRRNLKITEMEGADYSDDLQSAWESRVENELDYFDEEIVRQAGKLNVRLEKEYIDAFK